MTGVLISVEHEEVADQRRVKSSAKLSPGAEPGRLGRGQTVSIQELAIQARTTHRRHAGQRCQGPHETTVRVHDHRVK